MFDVKTVKLGTRGADTLLCQRLLYARGYKGKNKNNLALDGKCGENTVYAIKIFQRNNGLSEDGICGPKTWALLLGV